MDRLLFSRDKIRESYSVLVSLQHVTKLCGLKKKLKEELNMFYYT